MHTERNFRISEANPLILDFDLGKEYIFDTIIFNRGTTNGMYLPLNVKVYTSDDGAAWTDKGDYTCESSEDKLSILRFEAVKITTRYIRLSISKQMYGYYIAISTIDFVEEGVKFYLKPPEFAEFGGKELIEINFENFPYYGHSYILNPNSAISFLIEETTGIRVKVCHKYDSTVSLIVDNDNTATNEITIQAGDNLDYPIEIRDLEKGKHRFKIEVKSGKIDFEYILYEV